jgi:hypothetical protein
MRSFVLLGMIVGTVASAASAFAQSAPTPSPAAATEDPDRVVCHMGPAPTGSRLGSSRECHTQKQWDQMRLQQQQNVNNMQVQGLSSQPGGH